MAKYNDTNWVVYNMANSQIPNNAILDIAVDNWGIKWVGTYFGTGVGRYNSITNSWIVYNTQNSGLPNGYVYSILPENSRKWFATLGGLARFNDTSWVVFNTSNSPLPSNLILNLGLDSNRNLWISTAAGLAIYNENGILGVRKSEVKIPAGFVLYQNYPNPFNPVTTIKYLISNSNKIKLTIFDIQGKEITTLVNTHKKQGIYEVSFNGGNLSSGIYFYKLETPDYFLTKKMVLLK